MFGRDQSVRGEAGYVDDGGVPRLNVLDLQKLIRSMPKVVIALVAGYAIGGGHVLHVVCDLTIAADNAIFGQTGPKVVASTEALVPVILPALWVRKKPVKFGTFADSTMRRRHWIWAWLIKWYRSIN